MKSHFVGMQVVVLVSALANERMSAKGGETTDLQFSQPPAGGVLAEDEDELATLQVEQLRAGG